MSKYRVTFNEASQSWQCYSNCPFGSDTEEGAWVDALTEKERVIDSLSAEVKSIRSELAAAQDELDEEENALAILRDQMP